ncbi:hypothetical protein ANN_07968, partial [Periplaneta americana]
RLNNGNETTDEVRIMNDITNERLTELYRRGMRKLHFSQWLIPEFNSFCRFNTVVLQHDGTPRHYWNPVREWLSSLFPVWIGRGGPLNWSPRSPDLTTYDNWLCVKEKPSGSQMKSVRNF